MNVLEEANRLVHGPRQGDYGHPADVYARVGRIWGAILGVPDLPAATVCLLLAGLKLGREAERPKTDNLVDLAGYAEAVHMARERKQ
jgi:hypothetical protein